MDSLCHSDEFVSLLRDGLENSKHIITVALTLNLMNGRLENGCFDCCKSIKLVLQSRKLLFPLT